MKFEFQSMYVTRYMGSKLRLLDFIVPQILQGRSENFAFVDLMAGTHAVGYSLREYAQVYANDVQRYSEVVGRALIANHTMATIPARVRVDLELETRDLVAEGWFTKTYADTYFSRNQCREIETLRLAIARRTEEPLQSILLTALIHAMGYSQSSPGHFAQYMPAEHPRLQALRRLSVRESFHRYLAKLKINLTGSSNEVFQADVHDFLATAPDSVDNDSVVAYLDPPYSPAQYSRYYHLLETVVLNDEPKVAFKGLYRPDRFASKFCSERHVENEFRSIFAQIADRGWDLAVSYGTRALLDTEDLVGLAKEYFPNVNRSERPHPHSMQGRGVVNDRNEMLVMCRN